jgi:hypothetical protein
MTNDPLSLDSLRTENLRLNAELTESKRNNRALLNTLLEQHEALNAAVKQLESFTASRPNTSSVLDPLQTSTLTEVSKENQALKTQIQEHTEEIRQLKDVKSSLEYERT